MGNRRRRDREAPPDFVDFDYLGSLTPSEVRDYTAGWPKLTKSAAEIFDNKVKAARLRRLASPQVNDFSLARRLPPAAAAGEDAPTAAAAAAIAAAAGEHAPPAAVEGIQPAQLQEPIPVQAGHPPVDPATMNDDDAFVPIDPAIPK